MNLQMKNRSLRFLTIVAFVLGVLLIFNCVSFYNNILMLDSMEYKNMTDIEEGIVLLSGSIKMLEVNYYTYLAAGCIAFVLSIVFGKVTGIVTTVFRTIFLGIAMLCSFGGLGIIRVFSALRKLIDKIDFKNLDSNHHIIESIQNLTDSMDYETLAYLVPLVIVAIIIFFILSITAIVGLFKNYKGSIL